MTSPSERTKAVSDTRDFLRLLSDAEPIEIPGLVQSVARCLLKHFPSDVDLDVSSTSLPQIWAAPSSIRRVEPRFSPDSRVLRLPMRRDSRRL